MREYLSFKRYTPKGAVHSLHRQEKTKKEMVGHCAHDLNTSYHMQRWVVKSYMYMNLLGYMYTL